MIAHYKSPFPKKLSANEAKFSENKLNLHEVDLTSRTVSLKNITKEKKQNLSQSIQYAEGKNRIDNNSIITISSFKEKNNTKNNKINQSFSQPISIENASSGSIKKDYKKIFNFFTNSSRNESTVLNKYEKKTMEKKCKLVADPKDVQRRNFCGGKIPTVFWDFLGIVWRCWEVFGPVWIHLDAFQVVRMRSDAFGHIRIFRHHF